MQLRDIPFNIHLLELTDALVAGIEPVTSMDMFNGATRQLHEQGLFSLSIFGPVGSHDRKRRFSYIDVVVPIFQPTYYRALGQVKGFYLGILSGQKFAIWDEGICDFKLTTPNDPDGRTGFEFFVQHFKNIVYTETTSDKRTENIKFLEQNKHRALTTRVVVWPAGFRDIQADDTRIKVHEINSLYLRLLSIRNAFSESSAKNNPELIDGPRHSLQQAFNAVYETLEAMIDGKKKLVMNRFAARRVFNGTRNVITSLPTDSADLDDPNAVDPSDTVMGLFQVMKAILPVARYHIRYRYLADIFRASNMPVTLINAKTLQPESVQLPIEYFNRWATDEGIERVINLFQDHQTRHRPVRIGQHYLALIYIGEDHTFRILSDINSLTPQQRKRCRPVTLAELLYASVYTVANNYPVYVTRYPIAGLGSIYPSWIHLRTTVKPLKLQELGPDMQPLPNTPPAGFFPVLGDSFINAMSPSPFQLTGLNADFDGDMSSANAVYSDQAVQEVRDLLNSWRGYIGPDGKLMASASVDTTNYVFFNMSGD